MMEDSRELQLTLSILASASVLAIAFGISFFASFTKLTFLPPPLCNHSQLALFVIAPDWYAGRWRDTGVLLEAASAGG